MSPELHCTLTNHIKDCSTWSILVDEGVSDWWSKSSAFGGGSTTILFLFIVKVIVLLCVLSSKPFIFPVVTIQCLLGLFFPVFSCLLPLPPPLNEEQTLFWIQDQSLKTHLSVSPPFFSHCLSSLHLIPGRVPVSHYISCVLPSQPPPVQSCH